MKFRKIKYSVVFLALLLSAASCGQETGQVPAAEHTEPISAKLTDTEEAQTDEEISDNLPDTDLGGFHFRIYTADENTGAFVVEGENGEVVNDSIYQRQRNVEERFNVKLETIPSGFSITEISMQEYRKLIPSGDNFAEIGELHSVFGANLTLEGYFQNLYELPYLDLTQPWWYPQTVEEMTFMGKMFMGCNTITHLAMSSVETVFIDMALYDRFDLQESFGDLYQIAKDGKWTLDYMKMVSKDVYSDVNGDGIADDGDIYGALFTTNQEDLFVSLNASPLKKEEDALVVPIPNQRITDVVDSMYEYMYEQQSTAVISLDNYPMEQVNRFASGRTMMMIQEIDCCFMEEIRNADFEFGILPMPKFSEEEPYRSFAEGSYIGVPVTNPDLENTGLILEAMTAEGYRKIIPAYKEVALKGKYLRDKESAEMFDLIFDTYTASFAFNYDNWEGFAHLFGKLFKVNGGNKDVVSYMEKHQKSAIKRANTITDGFQSNG